MFSYSSVASFSIHLGTTPARHRWMLPGNERSREFLLLRNHMPKGISPYSSPQQQPKSKVPQKEKWISCLPGKAFRSISTTPPFSLQTFADKAHTILSSVSFPFFLKSTEMERQFVPPPLLHQLKLESSHPRGFSSLSVSISSVNAGRESLGTANCRILWKNSRDENGKETLGTVGIFIIILSPVVLLPGRTRTEKFIGKRESLEEKGV